MKKILVTLLLLLLFGGIGLQTTAAIDIDNMSVKVSSDGGALTWNNDTVAPIITTQGGTVKFGQRNPADTMAGVVYHLDASELTLNDGDAVATWNDVSGAGNNFSQGTANMRPTYHSSVAGLNGKPAVRFSNDDGTPDKITLPTPSGNGTIIIVGLMEGGKSDQWGGGLWGGEKSTGGGERQGIRFRTDQNSWNLRSRSGNDFTSPDSSGYFYSLGTTLPTGVDYSNGGLALDNNSSRRIGNGDGNPANFLLMSSRGTGIQNPFLNVSLGVYEGDRWWKGSVAEVICFDDPILDITTGGISADLQQLGYYLTQKYGLPADPRYPGTPIDTSIVDLVIEPGSGAGVTPETTIDVSEIPEFIAGSPVLFKSLTVNTGGTLQFSSGTLNTAEDVGSVTTDFLAGAGGTVALAGTDLTLGAGIAGSTTVRTFGGVISGTGSTLTKEGTETLVLTGANTYTGTTTINDGILQIGDGGSTGALAGDVLIAATKKLVLRRNNEHLFTDVFGGTITNNGEFEIDHATGGQTNVVNSANLPSNTTLTSGTLQLGNGAFTGSLTDAQSKVTFANNTVALALNLPGTTAAPGTAFNLNAGTLRLRGANTYNDTFISNTATNYDLVVDAGTKLEVRVTVGGAGLVAPNDITVMPEDLIINLSAISNAQDNDQFNVLDAGSGSIYKTTGGAAWTSSDAPATDTTSYPYHKVEYAYQNGLLSGLILDKVIPPTPQELGETTNPGAVNTLLDIRQNAPAGTALGDFQRKLQEEWSAGATITEIDQLVQQFTPSMASAAFSQSVTANAQILQQVASRIVAPWQQGNRGSRELVRAQNSSRYYVEKPSSLLGRRIASNIWFQSFGYHASQDVKEGFAAYDSRGWGFAVGADRKIGNLLLGMAYGYTSNKLESKPWVSGDPLPNEANIQTHTMLGYGLMSVGAKAFASAKVGGIWTPADGISQLPLLNQQATYATNGTTIFAQGTLGYNWITKPRFKFTPKMRFGYFSYAQQAYDIISEGSVALHTEEFNSAYWEADFLADWSYKIDQTFTMTGSFGYRGMFGADGAVLTVGSGDLQFPVLGVNPAKNILLVDAGVDCLLMENLTMILEYNLRAGNGGSTLHGGTGTFAWSW